MPETGRRTIREQIEYYRKRARGRDEWLARTVAGAGRPAEPLDADEREAVRALDAFRPRGDVLELACGPGAWTEHLVRHADRVRAVDASPEMIELNRARVADPRVEYEIADIFGWVPPRRFDAVVFAFWLSHVPRTHFDRFWELVARSLRPDGRVFFVDEGPHDLWREESVGENVVRRRLPDGSEHDVIKVLWPAAHLEQELRRLDWDVRVHSVGALYWGAGTRSLAG